MQRLIPVRIACIATSAVPSRTANSIQLMKACAALAEIGQDVALWVPGKPPAGGAAEACEFYGVRAPLGIRWLRSLRSLRGYDFCARACLAGRRWGAELFYVWPYQAAALCSTLGWPVLVEVHDRPYGRMGPALFRRTLRGRGLRRLLVTTEALRAWLEAEFKRPLAPPLALVAPNAAELADPPDRLSPSDWRSLLGLPEIFTAGYTGHLYAGRGLELLLGLARHLPEAQFLWVGGENLAVEPGSRTGAAQRRGQDRRAVTWPSGVSRTSTPVTKPLPRVSRTVTPVAYTGVSKPRVRNSVVPFGELGAQAVAKSP